MKVIVEAMKEYAQQKEDKLRIIYDELLILYKQPL